MDYTDISLQQFTQQLSSKSPVPGGGGASALAGALGCALGSMVGNLTLGKQKYSDVWQDIEMMLTQCAEIQSRLLKLIDEDAQVFAPLAAAYSLPSQTEEQKKHKEQVMEAALVRASEVPLQIMRQCCNAIDLHGEFSKKGSVLAISDVGVGVALCKAALEGASLNVFINTKAMSDRETAQCLNQQADGMLTHYCPLAEKIYREVTKRLR